jgi:hypothetical protein
VQKNKNKVVSLNLPEDLLVQIDALAERDMLDYATKNKHGASMTEWLYHTPSGRKANQQLIRDLTMGLSSQLSNRKIKVAYDDFIQSTNQELGRHVRTPSGSYRIDSFRDDVINRIISEYFER